MLCSPMAQNFAQGFFTNQLNKWPICKWVNWKMFCMNKTKLKN